MAGEVVGEIAEMKKLHILLINISILKKNLIDYKINFRSTKRESHINSISKKVVFY